MCILGVVIKTRKIEKLLYGHYQFNQVPYHLAVL